MFICFINTSTRKKHNSPYYPEYCNILAYKSLKEGRSPDVFMAEDGMSFYNFAGEMKSGSGTATSVCTNILLFMNNNEISVFVRENDT